MTLPFGSAEIYLGSFKELTRHMHCLKQAAAERVFLDYIKTMTSGPF